MRELAGRLILRFEILLSALFLADWTMVLEAQRLARTAGVMVHFGAVSLASIPPADVLGLYLFAQVDLALIVVGHRLWKRRIRKIQGFQTRSQIPVQGERGA